MDIVKICKHHGALLVKDVSTNNRCLACLREYAKEYRKKNPEKALEVRNRHNAKKKEIIAELGEYKPIKNSWRKREIQTVKICKKHGLLSYEDTILREGKYLRCRLCRFEASNAWQKRNPDKVKIHKRDTYLRNSARYAQDSILRQKGISLESYEELIAKQNNLCLICHREETTRQRKDGTRSPLAIDHCHKTGKIRGLLCRKCNTGIGLFDENIEFLLNAINYLRINNGSNDTECESNSS